MCITLDAKVIQLHYFHRTYQESMNVLLYRQNTCLKVYISVIYKQNSFT